MKSRRQRSMNTQVQTQDERLDKILMVNPEFDPGSRDGPGSLKKAYASGGGQKISKFP